MIIRSRAPLRIGIGGGGTDLDAYSSRFGGSVVNVTIQRFAHCVIRPKKDPKVSFYSADSGQSIDFFQSGDNPDLLPLHQGVYRRILRDYGDTPGFDLETFCDVPMGSGLGTSSASVVAQLAAYSHWLHLSLSKEKIANLAYEIEREDLGFSGGRQDHWASSFGGFNYLEFSKEGIVKLNPILLDPLFLQELEENFLLFYTGVSRHSHLISQVQSVNTLQNPITLKSLHTIKTESKKIREILQESNLEKLSFSMRASWEAKRKLANGISNTRLDEIYQVAMEAGVEAGKVLGAGGGGFMLFLVSPHKRAKVKKALAGFTGECFDVKIFHEGARAWNMTSMSTKSEALWNPTL